jgi:molybdopterin synthase sulfur carrier subunit
MIELRYFAWLRERIGTGRETVKTEARTVAELVAQLAAMDEGHAMAFADLKSLRVACARWRSFRR